MKAPISMVRMIPKRAMERPPMNTPTMEATTKRINARLPTIEDAARFYAKRTDVKEADFVAASKSFAVETRIAQAEKLMRAYRVDSTPTFVVAGKYRLHFESAGGADQAIELINFLVAKEAAAKR